MESIQLEQLMVAQNPQWRQDNYWEGHLAIKREVFSKLWENLTSNRLVLALSGSRRVGKSWLLRQLMAELVKTGYAAPQNILYFSFAANLDEKNIIRDLVDLFLGRYAKPHSPVYIFLDEAQFISYWPEQVKYYYDLELPIKFVVTGSTSLFYRQKSRESLLGRLLKIPIGVLSFGEYLVFRELPAVSHSRATFVSQLPLLRSEFRRYLVEGQLPEMAVGLKVDPTNYLLTVADQLINFDVPYLHAKVDRTLFTNLVKTLSIDLGNEMSVNKLAVGLGSKRQTINGYLQILQETGYFDLCYNGFFRKTRAKLSASKKIYALNTNLALAVNNLDSRYFSESRNIGHYAENYAYLRLRAKYPGGVEYYSDHAREIDFITPEAVYEVKYGVVGSLDKYQAIAKKLDKKLIVVTENEMSQTESELKIPIYLL